MYNILNMFTYIRMSSNLETVELVNICELRKRAKVKWFQTVLILDKYISIL